MESRAACTSASFLAYEETPLLVYAAAYVGFPYLLELMARRRCLAQSTDGCGSGAKLMQCLAEPATPITACVATRFAAQESGVRRGRHSIRGLLSASNSAA
jgi:hypothetical protein